MGRQYEEVRRVGGEALGVSFEPVDRLAWLRRTLDLPFPLLSDPSRDAYRAYGLGSGSTRRVFTPALGWAYLKLMLQGRRFRWPTSDVHQLGGDFVVRPDGTLHYVHRERGATDRPPVEDLLRLLAEANTTG